MCVFDLSILSVAFTWRLDAASEDVNNIGVGCRLKLSTYSWCKTDLGTSLISIFILVRTISWQCIEIGPYVIRQYDIIRRAVNQRHLADDYLL